MKKCLALFLLAASSMAFAHPECRKVIISADSDYAPLHWYDGKKLTGASIDIATHALAALHIPYEVRYVGPLQQVIKEAEDGTLDMVSSLKDSPERQRFLAFTNTPLFTNPIAVFVAKDRAFDYVGWKDLIGKKGGVTQGNRYGGGFDEFMKANLKVEPAQKVYINFTKLESGSIDYLITGYYSGLLHLAQTKQSDKFVPLYPYISETNNFIALSKASPCVGYLPQLNAQLATMQRNGEFDAILKRYAAELKIRYLNKARR